MTAILFALILPPSKQLLNISFQKVVQNFLDNSLYAEIHFILRNLNFYWEDL